MNHPLHESGAYNGPSSYYTQQSAGTAPNMSVAQTDRSATRDSQSAQNYASSMTPLNSMIFNERQRYRRLRSQNQGSTVTNAEYGNVTFSQPPTNRQLTSSGYQASSIAGRQQSSVAGGYYSESSRVVGHEYGPERVLSVTSKVDSTKSHIVNERYVEHEIRVPKRVTREDIIEKTVIVPERILHEEIVEETTKVREKIIEIARPIIVEKIVEVPEYEYVERIVEVPEIIKQDRIQHVEKIIQEERIKEVPRIIPVEKPYEVPDIKYRDVPVERVVYVDDWRDEVVVKEVPRPQYVDQPVPNVVQMEKVIDVERNIPIPVEANISYEFRIPKIKPRYHKITYPVYLPRFIEVPVALELLQGGLLQQTEMYLEKVGSLTKAAASLCEIENLATTIMNADIQSKISTLDLQSFIMKSWKEGSLNVGGMLGGSMHAITTNNYSFAPTGSVGPLMNSSGMLRVV